VVFNWLDEAARFTPRLRVQSYTGADRHARRGAFAEHDVIVTSYGLMRRDAAELRKHKFDYVILDEAQAIKNPASQAAKAARLLHAGHRLALTGTPVENHLGDLWSIFEFLNPGMLGSSGTFAQLVRGGGEEAGNGNGHGAAANGGTSLFGTVKLVSGQGAAGVSHITPGPNEFYQINNCPIQSINCIVLPVQPLPTLLPVNTLFFEVPLLPTDDPDLIDIMPNVWKRDY